MHPVMLGQDRALRVDHGPPSDRDALTQKGTGVPGRYEADVMAVRLFGNRQAATGGLGTDLPA